MAPVPTASCSMLGGRPWYHGQRVETLEHAHEADHTQHANETEGREPRGVRSPPHDLDEDLDQGGSYDAGIGDVPPVL